MAAASIFSTEVHSLELTRGVHDSVHESDRPLCACWPTDPLGWGTAHATLSAGTWAQQKQPVAGEVEVPD